LISVLDELLIIIEESPPAAQKPKRRLRTRQMFQKLVWSSPKIKSIKESLRRSWSNLHENPKGQADTKQPIDVNFSNPSAVFEERLKSVGVDPDWSRIPDESYQRAMAALTHAFAQNAKVCVPNIPVLYASMWPFLKNHTHNSVQRRSKDQITYKRIKILASKVEMEYSYIDILCPRLGAE